jgi:hypothetical protein
MGIVVSFDKKELPPICINGQDFTLKMSEADIAADLAVIMEASGEALKKTVDFPDLKVGDDIEELPAEAVDVMIESGKTVTDIKTAGMRLIEKMFGKGAYKKITAGSYFTSDDDLEVVQSVLTAVNEYKAQERREKNTLEGSKKAK